MKLYYLIIFGFLTISCSTWKQEKNNSLKKFNDFLGREKAMALHSAVESFDQFLVANYPNLNNQSERIKAFLGYFEQNFEPDSTWALLTSKNQKIISDFESSGLRKEIWSYGYEEYNPKYDIYKILPLKEESISKEKLGKVLLEDLIEEEITFISSLDSIEIANQEKGIEEKWRSSLSFNIYGQFLYAIAKYNLDDKIIQEYLEGKITATDISHCVIASGFLGQKINFDNPFIKRILVIEFYYWVMDWDIKRKLKW